MTLINRFTFEFWINLKKLYPNGSYLFGQKYFWSLFIEPSAQTWAPVFYSPQEQKDRMYPTYKFAPLNTWIYGMLSFESNKVRFVTYPNYSVNEINLDPVIHNYQYGSGSNLHIIGGSAQIFKIKYWEKIIPISEQSIVYPQHTNDPYANGLLYYYQFTYANFRPELTENGLFPNLGKESSNYILANTETTFINYPPACNSVSVYANNICSDQGKYLKFNDETSRGLLTIMQDSNNDLTFEAWIFSTESSQKSTIFEIQNQAKLTQMKVTLDSGSFVCYPNINLLTIDVKSKITVDMLNKWVHLSCSISGSISETKTYYDDGNTLMSHIITSEPILAQGAGLYLAYVGKNFVGYIKELRLWRLARSQVQIANYRHQTIDTFEENELAQMIKLYYPFSTESDSKIYKSGISSILEPEPLRFVAIADDYEKIGYEILENDLIICPVGFVFHESSCIKPQFNLQITDLQTDYKIELIKNIPDSNTKFSYSWLYPEVSPYDYELQNYLDSKINSVTKNTVLIFKPALKSDRTIKFVINITPAIYSKYFNSQIVLSKTQEFKYTISCPALTLNATNIEISNLDYSNVIIQASFSSCSVPYIVNFINWNLTKSGIDQSYIPAEFENNKQLIKITKQYFSQYDMGIQYIFLISANVSMTSTIGDQFDISLNSQFSFIRHNYALSLVTSGSTNYYAFESIDFSARHYLYKNDIRQSEIQFPVNESVQCEASIPQQMCNSIKSNLVMAPDKRLKLNLRSGILLFIFKAQWNSINSQASVSIHLNPSNPYIERKIQSPFYEYQIFQLFSNSPPVCSLTELQYKWYIYDSATFNTDSARILSETYELVFSNSNIINPQTKLVCEISCNRTYSKYYDFIPEIYEPDLDSFEPKVSTSFSLTPLKDPFVIDLEQQNIGTFGNYMLQVKDLITNSYIPSQIIFPYNEQEIYLPYTQSVQLIKSKGISTQYKEYNITFINIYSTSVDQYFVKYLNNTEKLLDLLYTILHVRNTRNKFSETQHTAILEYLSNNQTLLNITQIQPIFIELFIDAITHIGSELHENIEEYTMWLNIIINLVKYHKKFQCKDWKVSIEFLASTISEIMIKYFIKIQYKFKKDKLAILIVKIKEICIFLQEWILSELVIFDKFTVNTNLFSISGYVFTNNLPTIYENLTVNFAHEKQSSLLTFPILFAKNAFTEDSLFNQNLTRFGISLISYDSNLLYYDNYTSLKPISQSFSNFSFYQFSDPYSNSTLLPLPGNTKIINKYFRPMIKYYDLHSPTNISESLCQCPGILNFTCRTRVDFENQCVFCEFDSVGVLLTSVNYTEPKIIIFEGNIMLLGIYIGISIILVSSLLILMEYLDKQNSKEFENEEFPLEVNSIYQHLRTKILSEWGLPFSLMGTVVLVSKYFHPLYSLLTKYNPVIPRFNRLIFIIFVGQIISTILLFLLDYYEEMIKFSKTSNKIEFSIFFSFIFWPFYLILSIIYKKIMERTYKINLIPYENPKRLINYTNPLLDATYRQALIEPSHIQTIDGVVHNPENQENEIKMENIETFGIKRKNLDNIESEGHLDESVIRRETQEGQIKHINESGKFVSNLSIIIVNDNKASYYDIPKTYEKTSNGVEKLKDCKNDSNFTLGKETEKNDNVEGASNPQSFDKADDMLETPKNCENPEENNDFFYPL